MVDIAHWLVHEKKVKEVVAVARRGPAQRATLMLKFRPSRQILTPMIEK
ncbi:MAG: hypothetical protein IPO77_12095 [Acidobacteria bacterium]|nr:hypothetical protein [Acidobacteriota bacterium]